MPNSNALNPKQFNNDNNFSLLGKTGSFASLKRLKILERKNSRDALSLLLDKNWRSEEIQQFPFLLLPRNFWRFSLKSLFYRLSLCRFYLLIYIKNCIHKVLLCLFSELLFFEFINL